MDISAASISLASNSAAVSAGVEMVNGASEQLEAVMTTLLEGITDLGAALPDHKGTLLNVTA